MPRVRLRDLPEEREIYEELYSRYGGSMSLADIKEYLGIKDYYAAQPFVSGLVRYEITRRAAQYRTRDVARRYAERREAAR